MTEMPEKADNRIPIVCYSLLYVGIFSVVQDFGKMY